MRRSDENYFAGELRERLPSLVRRREFGVEWLSGYGSRFVVCGLALLGSWAILLVTPWGIGLAPDSLVYVGVARSLLRGEGVVYLSDTGQFVPVTHYPPLYSLLLAGFGLIGGEPLVAARWLNAFFFAGNIILVGFMVSSSTRSAPASVFAAFVMLSSFPMVQIHSMAWSEPVAIFFGFLGIFGLVKYLQGCGRWMLFGSSLSVATSCLSRYAGIPFLITGAMAVFFLGEQKWRRKIADGGSFLALASLPLFAWVLRNWWSGGSPVNRTLAFHPPQLDEFKIALDAIGLWFFPSGLVNHAPWIGGLALGIGAVSLWRLKKEDGFSKSRLNQVAGLFFVTYGLFVLAARALIDRAIEFDTRILSPAYVALLILTVTVVTNWIKQYRLKTKSWKWFSFDCLIIALSALQMTNGVAWSLYSYTNGIGYSGKQWRESELVKFVATVDPTVPIFTNAPDLLYLLTGRVTDMIPRKVAPETHLPNGAFSSELDQMKKQLEERNGALVYFSVESRLWFLPAKSELERALPLQTVISATDGTIYKAKNLAMLPGR